MRRTPLLAAPGLALGLILTAAAQSDPPLYPVTITVTGPDARARLVPLPKLNLMVLPYDLARLKEHLAYDNGAGNPPHRPRPEDVRYRTTDIVMNVGLDRQHYESDLLGHQLHCLKWQHKAYKGLDEACRKAANGRRSTIITTDASGKVTAWLPKGRWFLAGVYAPQPGVPELHWNVPVQVPASDGQVQLSPANATACADCD